MTSSVTGARFESLFQEAMCEKLHQFESLQRDDKEVNAD